MSYLLRRRKLGAGSCRGISAASTTGLQVIRNDAQLPDADWVFRWGCTSNVPNGRIVNEARAIHWASDKRASRLALQEAGVSVPKTWGSEEEFGEALYPWGYPANYQEEMQYVARPVTHAQGRNLAYGSPSTVAAALIRWGGGYISELIAKVAEYRVFVLQGRAVWVAKKTPGNPYQVAWNVAQGGRFDNVAWGDWPLRVVKEAIKAHDVSGLDFSGVDVMVDAAGTPYVLELNAAPSQTSPYRQSCVAKGFDWIITHYSKAPIPLYEQRGGWRKFIHPAISEEAWV